MWFCLGATYSCHQSLEKHTCQFSHHSSPQNVGGQIWIKTYCLTVQKVCYTQRKQKLVNHLHFRHNAYCIYIQYRTTWGVWLSQWIHSLKHAQLLHYHLTGRGSCQFTAWYLVWTISVQAPKCCQIRAGGRWHAVPNTYLGSRSSWGLACACSGRAAALVREWRTAQVQTGNPQIWWHWTHDLSGPSPRHLETNTPKSKI